MDAIAIFLPLFKVKRQELKEAESLDRDGKYLLKMVSMLLFHAHLLLLKSDSFLRGKREFKSEESREVVKGYFADLIKTETSLPAPFCVDVLTKYLMFDEVLLYLFYRRDYKELLAMIRKNFEKEHAKSAEIRESISHKTL